VAAFVAKGLVAEELGVEKYVAETCMRWKISKKGLRKLVLLSAWEMLPVQPEE
jgi:hypothetical protein